MSDQSSNVGNYVKAFFSAPMLAALRNVLSAVGILLGLVGVVALSPQQIDHIISVAQQIGTTVGAIAALLGLATPVIMGTIAAFKGTDKNNIARTAAIAQDPTQAQSEPAQSALVQATAAIASNNVLAKSGEAKQTLIAATVALPEVQTIVTDKATADAAPSESVVAAESVTINPSSKAS